MMRSFLSGSTSFGWFPEYRSFFWSLLLVCLISLSGPFSANAQVETEEKLSVLYIYDSREGETDQENDGDELYGRPLAWLGLTLDTFDVADPAKKPPQDMSRYRGIIAPSGAWDASPYWTKWLGRQIHSGIKVLITSTAVLEAHHDQGSSPAREPLADEIVNTVYEPLGFHLVSSMTASAAEDIVRVKQIDESFFHFEAELPKNHHYVKVEKVSDAVESYLTLWWEGLQGTEAELVASSPYGGYALFEYLFAIDVKRDLRFWRVNPFRFLEKVFSTEGLPRIEPNVISGKRTYFSHVDGDGFNSYSWYRRNRICADVLLDEIYTHPDYGKLPVTLSVIGAEMDENTTHCLPVTKMTARKLFALDNVESASHGYAHPMDWRTLELCWPGIEVSGKEYVYDAVTETTGALEQATELSPEGKRATIALWTGNCNPDEEALRRVREGGYQNMNGGDTRYDSKVPTLTGVAPPSVRVGSEIRVNTGQANDYILTDEWKDFGGFSALIETFEKSANPIILPLNIYYHFYAGERKKALYALKKNLDWVLKAETTPVWTSQYAASIVATRSAKLFRIGKGAFRIEHTGEIPTLRFDGAQGKKEAFYPDFTKSKGITGWRHLNDSLYVYLDGSTSSEIFLTDKRPRSFALLQSNRPVTELLFEESTGEFSFATWGPPEGTFIFQGLASSQAYGIRFVADTGELGAQTNFRTNDRGALSFSIPMNASGKVLARPISARDYAWIKFTHFFWTRGRFLSLGVFLGLILWIAIRRKRAGEL